MDNFPSATDLPEGTSLDYKQTILYAKEFSQLFQAEKARRIELESAYQEIRNFLDLAAHDLREPIRKISIFCELLKKSEEGLGPKGQENLKRLKKSSDRMMGHIEKLARISEIHAHRVKLQPLKLNLEVQNILKRYERQFFLEDDHVEVRNLPQLESDRTLLEQLLTQLIDNGIKFRKKDRPLNLVIEGEISTSGAWIAVRDNGIGFDIKHKDRIIKPFERLNGRSEFEGTGLGLAICNTILTKLKGTFDIQSQPGVGSSFSIFIPNG